MILSSRTRQLLFHFNHAVPVPVLFKVSLYVKKLVFDFCILFETEDVTIIIIKILKNKHTIKHKYHVT